MEDHRERLERDLEAYGTWRKVGEQYGVNHKFPYEFVTRGVMPPKKIARKLGIVSSSVLATRERNAILNKVAIGWKYKSWSAYETSVINDYKEEQECEPK